jgi:hypothetical protein
MESQRNYEHHLGENRHKVGIMKFISIGYYTNGASVPRFQERDL